MKKSKLRPLNKNALKAVAVTALVGMLGAQAVVQQVKRTKHEQALNDFKEDLIEYKMQNDGQAMNQTTETAEMETIDISKKFPNIAIIYHTNGKISLMFDREYLSLEAAMEKYPDLTANISAYINATKADTTAVKSEKTIDRNAVTYIGNWIE